MIRIINGILHARHIQKSIIDHHAGLTLVKIALINSEYPSLSGADHGGIATYTYTLANFLSRAGHTVHLLTRSGVHGDEIGPGIRVHHIQSYWKRNFANRIFKRFDHSPVSWEKSLACGVRKCLLEIQRQDGLDIVEFPEYGGLGMCAGSIPGCTSVVTLHTPSELVDELNEQPVDSLKRSLYRMERKTITSADFCKSPSDALRQQVCRRYHLEEQNVTLLRNPFDIKELRNTFHAKDESCTARFDILFSGRLEYRKGAEIISRSVRSILSLHRNIALTIAGETEINGHQDYRAAIEHMLNREDRTRIWFPGPVPHKKLLPLYKNSSLFLFPSLFENAPYALLEAMACGLPVVAANTGGISELIRDGETGLLFAPGDASEPVASIKRIFDNREFGLRLGQNAAAFISEKFDPDTITAEYVNFYQTIHQKKHPS